MNYAYQRATAVRLAELYELFTEWQGAFGHELLHRLSESTYRPNIIPFGFGVVVLERSLIHEAMGPSVFVVVL